MLTTVLYRRWRCKHSHFTDEKTVESERARELVHCGTVSRRIRFAPKPVLVTSVYNFLPDSCIWEFFHCLQGLSTVKMFSCLLDRGAKRAIVQRVTKSQTQLSDCTHTHAQVAKRFPFKSQVTISFHPSHFSCQPWLEGNKRSSNTNQLYAFLQLTLLSSLMSSMVSKLKTWRSKAVRVQGHLQWACPRLHSREKKH